EDGRGLKIDNRMKLQSTRSRFPYLWLLSLSLVCLVSVSAFAAGNPDNSKSLNRAERALRSGDFERAEQIYRELLAKDDHDIDARLGLSRVLLKERRLQDSFDHAARVLAVQPLSARAHAL